MMKPQPVDHQCQHRHGRRKRLLKAFLVMASGVQTTTAASSPHGSSSPLSLAVLTPHEVWKSHKGSSSDAYRETLQKALDQAAGVVFPGRNVSCTWRDVGRRQAMSVAQMLFRQDPQLELVMAPSFQVPFRTTYYTRRDIPGSSRENSSSSSVKITATAVTIPPYSKAFNAAAGLCHHFGWRNVVVMNSDDHFMSLAQRFRQRLSEEAINIRSHTIFSSLLPDDEVGGPTRVHVSKRNPHLCPP